MLTCALSDKNIDAACRLAEGLEKDPFHKAWIMTNLLEYSHVMFLEALLSANPNLLVDLHGELPSDEFIKLSDRVHDSASKLLTGEKKVAELRLTKEEAATGVLAIRSFYANLAYTYRMNCLGRLGPNSPGFPLWLTGFTVIPNFMGREYADRISSGFADLHSAADVSKRPENLFLNWVNRHPGAGTEDVEFFWKLRQVLGPCMGVPPNNKEVVDSIFQKTFFQKVNNVPGNGDVQKVLHSDTYYDALKFWYFPNDVKEEDGPFAYVPMSHVLSEKRLQFIQDQSMKYYTGSIEDWRTYGHAEGSLRISQEELKDMGLKERLMTVAGDTLVVANVFGFHRRAEAHVPSERLAIHGSVRYDSPFTL